MTLTPNRVAVYLTAGASLAAALSPIVADLDVQSTAGIYGSLAAVLIVVLKWLEGWQQHEHRAFYGIVEAQPEPVEAVADKSIGFGA